ncbi:hypothetical protein POTOM_017299 [Populus tomentosa]|uniref:Serine aminopeptidase S33 domain-containing protein n=1 Tax=Populus tomentosa TaxID=118781 RepID=A0A8X7ZYN0_POPTO|nr:hypothetical protein POTOM_017299 [Populus tomentosa]
MEVSTGVARKLASSGYGVFAMDYPGFGLSDGPHGYFPSLDKLVNDVAEHYSNIKFTDNTIPPWFVKQILTGVAQVFPKLKIVPHQNLVKTAFRDSKRQELIIGELPTWFNVFRQLLKAKNHMKFSGVVVLIDYAKFFLVFSDGYGLIRNGNILRVSLSLLILLGEADPSVSKGVA